MGHKFPKVHLQTLYNYIKMHDGETLTQKKIAAFTGISPKTIRKDLKYLQKRDIIQIDEFKTFTLIDY